MSAERIKLIDAGMQDAITRKENFASYLEERFNEHRAEVNSYNSFWLGSVHDRFVYKFNTEWFPNYESCVACLMTQAADMRRILQLKQAKDKMLKNTLESASSNGDSRFAFDTGSATGVSPLTSRMNGTDVGASSLFRFPPPVIRQPNPIAFGIASRLIREALERFRDPLDEFMDLPQEQRHLVMMMLRNRISQSDMRRSNELAIEAWNNSIAWAESERIWEPGNRENMRQPAREWEDDAHRHFFWALNNSREFGRNTANLILNLYEVHNLLGYETFDEEGNLIVQWVTEPRNIRSMSPIAPFNRNVVTRMNPATLMDLWNNRVGVELGQMDNPFDTDQELFNWAMEEGLLITHPAQVNAVLNVVNTEDVNDPNYNCRFDPQHPIFSCPRYADIGNYGDCDFNNLPLEADRKMKKVILSLTILIIIISTPILIFTSARSTIERVVAHSAYSNANYIVIQGKRYHKSLTYLDLSRSNLRDEDIVALRYMSHLTELYIGNPAETIYWERNEWNLNQFSDLSPLSELTNLVKLDLTYTLVNDLTPLSGLTSLEELRLSNNEINDLMILSNLSKLEVLELRNNQFVNIAPLSELVNLKVLNLGGNQSNDLTPLSGLTDLEVLLLWDAQIVNITPLSGLVNLKNLSLGNNHIHDLMPLSNLTNLEILSLHRNNRVNNLYPLSGLMNLTSLDLGSNQISDLKPLSSLSSLASLHLESNQISDLTPLSSLTNLTQLSLCRNQISDLSPLYKLTSLDRVRVSNNPVIDWTPIDHVPDIESRSSMTDEEVAEANQAVFDRVSGYSNFTRSCKPQVYCRRSLDDVL